MPSFTGDRARSGRAGHASPPSRCGAAYLRSARHSGKPPLGVSRRTMPLPARDVFATVNPFLVARRPWCLPAAHSWPRFVAAAPPAVASGREPDGEVAVLLRKLK